MLAVAAVWLSTGLTGLLVAQAGVAEALLTFLVGGRELFLSHRPTQAVAAGVGMARMPHHIQMPTAAPAS